MRSVSSFTLAAGWALRRGREAADPVAVRLALARAPHSAVPPRRLRARVGAPGVRSFVEGGRQAAVELASAAESLSSQSVLDFGCGPGRVLPWFVSLGSGLDGVGCDVDAEAVAWARRHHPELEWAVNSSSPPLRFDGEQFDLVYSISVFSHLREAAQFDWLKEIRRVLRPGGIALLSVHGPSAFERFSNGEVGTHWCPRSAFERGPLGGDEFLFVPYVRSRWNHADLPGVGDEYGITFHGHDYLRERWPPTLEVLELRERAIADWQDLVVCSKAR